MHPRDEDTLGAILGGAALSEEVIQEYNLRLLMYHASGSSGALGAIGLIDLVRSLNYGPKPVAYSEPLIDWRDYPSDGSTHVEARYMGIWQSGVFLGFVESGSLAVRLEGDPVVRECNRGMVRLRATDRPTEDTPEVETASSLAVSEELEESDPVDTLVEGNDVWVDTDDGVINAVFKSHDEVVKGEKTAWVESNAGKSMKVPLSSLRLVK